ncbi:hypothetical protein B0H13DRAFT_2659718 [Mycena leptocephala]|nr:hypothetical protein B0H13DRAFT_2659718 [Mycena leptocephala]
MEQHLRDRHPKWELTKSRADRDVFAAVFSISELERRNLGAVRVAVPPPSPPGQSENSQDALVGENRGQKRPPVSPAGTPVEVVFSEFLVPLQTSDPEPPWSALVPRNLFLCCARIRPFNPAGSARVFAAEFVHAALPPTWERSAFRLCALDSTTPRTIEWAVLPALAYSCSLASDRVRLPVCPSTALALCTSLRKTMCGLAPKSGTRDASLAISTPEFTRPLLRVKIFVNVGMRARNAQCIAPLLPTYIWPDLALVPFRGHRLLHLDRTGAHPPSSFVRSAPSIIVVCVLPTSTTPRHLLYCPPPLSALDLRSSTTPIRHLLEAREPAPVRARVLCAGGLSPAAPHGDARAPRRVLRIPKQYRLREQARVRARPSPPPPRPSPRSSWTAYVKIQDTPAVESDPSADPCADAARAQGSQRRAECRALTPPAPNLVIWDAIRAGAGERTYGAARRWSTSTYVARRCRRSTSGRGRRIRTDPPRRSRGVEVRRVAGGRECAVEVPALLLCGTGLVWEGQERWHGTRRTILFLLLRRTCTHGASSMCKRKCIWSRISHPAPLALALLKAIPDRLPSLLDCRDSHSWDLDAGSQGKKGTARPPFTPAPPIHTCRAPPTFCPRRPFPPPPDSHGVYDPANLRDRRMRSVEPCLALPPPSPRSFVFHRAVLD